MSNVLVVAACLAAALPACQERPAPVRRDLVPSGTTLEARTQAGRVLLRVSTDGERKVVRLSTDSRCSQNGAGWRSFVLPVRSGGEFGSRQRGVQSEYSIEGRLEGRGSAVGSLRFRRFDVEEVDDGPESHHLERTGTSCDSGQHEWRADVLPSAGVSALDVMLGRSASWEHEQMAAGDGKIWAASSALYDVDVSTGSAKAVVDGAVDGVAVADDQVWYLTSDMLRRFDPTSGESTGEVDLPGHPEVRSGSKLIAGGPSSAAGRVWALTYHTVFESLRAGVMELDVASGKVTPHWVDEPACEPGHFVPWLITGGDAIWLVTCDNRLHRVTPGNVGPPFATPGDAYVDAAAVMPDGSLVVATGKGLARFEPSGSGAAGEEAPMPEGCGSVEDAATTESATWLVCKGRGSWRLVRLQPDMTEAGSVEVAEESWLANGDRLWLVSPADAPMPWASARRVDEGTGKLGDAGYAGPSVAAALAVGDALWAYNGDGTLTRLGP